MSDSTYATRLHTVETFLNQLGHEIVPAHLESLLAPNVTYTVPGRGKLSGRFSGISEVAEHLDRLVEAVRGTLDVLQWEDRMVGINYISVLGRLQVQVSGQVASERRIFLFGFDDRQRIGSIEVFIEDHDQAVSLF